MSHYRSPKLLRSAKGQSCANPRCNSGWGDGTVSAHVNSVKLGKGVGIKAPDYYTAHLCPECHALVDGRTGHLSKEEKWAMWIEAYLVTVARWFNAGVVK